MLNNPGRLLRVEGAVLLVLSIGAYSHVHGSWLLFAVLFLAPDLFMLGYLANARLGAATYNAVHTLAVPLLLLGFAVGWRHPVAAAVALIWIAHIGLDRMLGYGLKYPTFFKDTHLQRV
jgi:hypothetical protein